MAELLRDGPLFFPNILLNEDFQKKGIVWGTENYGSIGLHWTVIDPRRHTMYVWEKKVDHFVSAAYSLGASAFSNGPFLRYKGGNKYQASYKVLVDSINDTIRYAQARSMNTFVSPYITPFTTPEEDLSNVISIFNHNGKKHWTGHDPDGNIIGTREGISVLGKHQSFHHHFGRKQNRFFDDYVIGQGPAGENSGEGFTEVIGGLFRTVNEYAAVDPQESSIGAGHWGLAPLVEHSTATDGPLVDPEIPRLDEAVVKKALSEYHQKEKEFAVEYPEGFVPPVQGAPLATGLIIAAFYWGDVQTIASKLVEIRVRNAVRVDGNASILLGHHNTAVVGANMPKYKYEYNKWGYQFQSE